MLRKGQYCISPFTNTAVIHSVILEFLKSGSHISHAKWHLRKLFEMFKTGGYLTIIPRTGVGYEVIDSRRGASGIIVLLNLNH